MNNHIVTERAFKVREIARNSLKGYWKPMFLAVLIYYLLTTAIGNILALIFYYDLNDVYMSIGVPELVSDTVKYVEYGGALYDFIVGGPFMLGLYSLLLTFFRMKKVDNSLIFEGFGSFIKAFMLQFLITIRVALWSLLLVIPGIIAAYRYSQAFFVLADHPEYTATQCINESKRLMNGNKWRLFCIQFSFIGWSLLASVPSGLLATMFSFEGFGSVITALISSIPMLILNEYTYMADVAFYELVTERLVVVSDGETEYTRTVEADYTVTENDDQNREQ